MIWCAWWPFFVSFFGQTKKEKLKRGFKLSKQFQLKMFYRVLTFDPQPKLINELQQPLHCKLPINYFLQNKFPVQDLLNRL